MRKRKNVVRKKQTKIISSRTVVFFMLIVLLVALILTTIYASAIVKKSSQQPFEIRFVPYDFKVTKGAGFILDNDSLHFGEGEPGMTLSREINLSSSRKAFVEIYWEGEGNISVDINDFILDANTTQSIQFYLPITNNLALGNHSGMVYFNFYKR